MRVVMSEYIIIFPPLPKLRLCSGLLYSRELQQCVDQVNLFCFFCSFLNKKIEFSVFLLGPTWMCRVYLVDPSSEQPSTHKCSWAQSFRLVSCYIVSWPDSISKVHLWSLKFICSLAPLVREVGMSALPFLIFYLVFISCCS